MIWFAVGFVAGLIAMAIAHRSRRLFGIPEPRVDLAAELRAHLPQEAK